MALPDQLFYNTGISTYIWVLTNRKDPSRAGKVQLIDGRQFFVKMRKSLGKKRNQLADTQIADLVRIHGNFAHGETRDLTDTDPVTHQPRTRPRVVSKIFANEDFGYRKVTVERPLRLNFAATPERIARLDDNKAFQNLATSRKRPGRVHDTEVAAGQARQKLIRSLLELLSHTTGGEVMHNREKFLEALSSEADAQCIRLSAAERKMVLTALGERDPQAEICLARNGNPEPDAKLRDTETVPLSEDIGEDIGEYIAREVLPHVPDAWVNHTKTKTGYEIPLNRHFYVYEPPRPLNKIKADLQTLEHTITQMLAEITT